MTGPARPDRQLDGELAGLVEQLCDTFVRPERVAAVRERLATGAAISSLDVADALLAPFRDLPAAS